MTKHTATPWELGEYNEYGGYDCMTGAVDAGPVTLDANDYGQKPCKSITPEQLDAMMSDARFIVQAVNSHDELVGACQYAIDCIDGNVRDYADILPQKLRTALARAKGEAV